MKGTYRIEAVTLNFKSRFQKVVDKLSPTPYLPSMYTVHDVGESFSHTTIAPRLLYCACLCAIAGNTHPARVQSRRADTSQLSEQNDVSYTV